MSHWTWQNWNDTPYLTCSLLDCWNHGFFTRQFWPQPPAELVDAVDSDASVCRIKQVHSSVVLAGSDVQQQTAEQFGSSGLTYPEADGLYSDAFNQSLWVCSADCTPLLIGDRNTGHTAAVHAGWRGTAAQIVPNAIKKLLAQGSQLADLRIAMGPAIAGSVYQVTIEVAEKMADSLVSTVAEPNAGKSVIQSLCDQESPPFLPDSEPGRIRLDVRRVNAMQLEALGIAPEQIAIAPHCTFQEPDRFFSYRRDGLKKVQWAGIVSGTD